ncbi:MAG: hypothetical protein KME01_12100 [Chroococcus sp. CMT-3BRIN-NPC107]|jgi:hypothetical protein|nr:hypothetical protein [Chroococcus sp. CMT-3BRIN-NPC107]
MKDNKVIKWGVAIALAVGVFQPIATFSNGISAVGCAQATRIINNPREMVDACAKYGIYLQLADGEVNYNEDRANSMTSTGCKEIASNQSPAMGFKPGDLTFVDSPQIVFDCYEFGVSLNNGNEFGEVNH